MSKIIYHIHHIVPKHMGGTDDPSNLVKLTVKEHAEAHRILYEKYGLWQDKLAWMGLSKMIDKQEIISIAQSNASKDRLKKFGNPLQGRQTSTNFKLNPEHQRKAIEKAWTENARKKRLENGFGKGNKNSQYGKRIYVHKDTIEIPCIQELNSKHKFYPNQQPENWILLSDWKESKKDKTNNCYGKHWYTDGVNNYLLKESESVGLKRGRILSINNNDK